MSIRGRLLLLTYLMAFGFIFTPQPASAQSLNIEITLNHYSGLDGAYEHGSQVGITAVFRSSGAIVDPTITAANILRPDNTIEQLLGTQKKVGLVYDINYDIPSSAPVGTYLIRISATYQGLSSSNEATFRVTTLKEKAKIISAVDGNSATVNNYKSTASNSITFTLSTTPGTQAVAGYECKLDSAAVFSLCPNLAPSPSGQTSTHSFSTPSAHRLWVRPVNGAVEVGGADLFVWLAGVAITTPGLADYLVEGGGGETVIDVFNTASDVAQVRLPAGTTFQNAVTISYSYQGGTTSLEISGVNVPYPPGKTIILYMYGPVANAVCIVDNPSMAKVSDPATCPTNIANSQVSIQCNGTSQTFSGFPDTPSARTYRCGVDTLLDFPAPGVNTPVIIVEGLSYSFIMIKTTSINTTMYVVVAVTSLLLIIVAFLF